MSIVVRTPERPDDVLALAGDFLASDPVRHNVILTLLHGRSAFPEPGHYWVVELGGRCVGVAFQSPLHYFATVTPMPDPAIVALVDQIVGAGVQLPGVSGVAATAALFAGQWTERTKSAATPAQGQRIYEVVQLATSRHSDGGLRMAEATDCDLLVEWFDAFGQEVGERASDAAVVVQRRLELGHLWVWDDAGPVAMAGLSDARAGVVRVGPVYTPPDRRNRGYASALVAELSAAVLGQSLHCILYTDLANPVSNSIYRAIGYRAVAEVLRYDFSPSR
ncbi:MAG TPA: GNAT family N-acetyltransferase [Acidimicrobiales bacterium]|nr:GNAT family N-acetyltransferase [Acidimicrobiales bacterium]